GRGATPRWSGRRRWGCSSRSRSPAGPPAGASATRRRGGARGGAEPPPPLAGAPPRGAGRRGPAGGPRGRRGGGRGGARRGRGGGGREGAEELRQEVQQLLTDLQMIPKLEEALLAKTGVKNETFDLAASDTAYREAFLWYELDVERLPAEEAGRRTRGHFIPVE